MGLFETIETQRLKIAEFLAQPVDINGLFHDVWSFVHLLFGVLIAVVIIRTRLFKMFGTKVIFIFLLILFVFYEILEISIGAPFFSPETNFNIVMDILLALFGAFLVFRMGLFR